MDKQSQMDALLKELALETENAISIKLVQNYISGERIKDNVLKMLFGAEGIEKNAPEKKDTKVPFEDVPVIWHEPGERQKKGKRIILSDGISKHGFYNLQNCDEFLGEYRGYTSNKLTTGAKILSYHDQKEWFVYEGGK